MAPPHCPLSQKIGYLIPEFPAQTHNFFWRERQALQDLGLELQLISTRRPPLGLKAASWSDQAQRQTTYLFPPSPAMLRRSLLQLLQAGPRAWYTCISRVAQAQDLDGKPLPLRQKLRLMALLLPAAGLAYHSQQQGWRHVHVHSCADAANVAMFAAVLAPLTYSLTLHNPLSVYGPNQPQKWRSARFALVITEKIYHDVVKQLAGSLPPRLAIAPMGVDCDRFVRSQPYQAYSGTGPVRLFSCGRLNPCKGHQNLIAAVSQLRRQGLDVSLVIAGEDDQGGSGYRSVLEALVRSLDLDRAVTLLGAVSEETVQQHLEQAHAFVLASSEEPLGVAIMESMAMAVPTIATDAGGVPELIENGVDGLLVPPGDVEALTAAIAHLLQDVALAQRLSSAGPRKIVAKFSHRRSASAIATLLAETRPTQYRHSAAVAGAQR